MEHSIICDYGKRHTLSSGEFSTSLNPPHNNLSFILKKFNIMGSCSILLILVSFESVILNYRFPGFQFCDSFWLKFV
jgi:hypothetical protein